MLGKSGTEGLMYLIVLELMHLHYEHLRKNLHKKFKYGDLKKQLMGFKNQYTGFDALFIDYYTNSRYELS